MWRHSWKIKNNQLKDKINYNLNKHKQKHRYIKHNKSIYKKINQMNILWINLQNILVLIEWKDLKISDSLYVFTLFV